MKLKNLIKSKTFWVGVATVAYGAVQVVQGDQSNGISSVLLGVGMITGRNAIEKLK